MSPYDNVNGFWLSLIAVTVEAPAHFTFMVLKGILLWPYSSQKSTTGAKTYRSMKSFGT